MGDPEFGVNHNKDSKMSKYTVTAWLTTSSNMVFQSRLTAFHPSIVRIEFSPNLDTIAEARIRYRNCSECGGHIKVIACLEDPIVIEKIL